MDSWVAWHGNDCPLENNYCLVKALKGREGWDALYLKVFQPLFSTRTQVSLLTSPNMVVTGFFGAWEWGEICKIKIFVNLKGCAISMKKLILYGPQQIIEVVIIMQFQITCLWEAFMQGSSGNYI